MKLTKHDNKLETNFLAESKDFEIGDASVIIEILRNRLYKHKIRTLVQEYICNGRDAIREAKSTKPIQITTPTLLEPTFKVRDFGLGISPDRMDNVFRKYGSSTKRNTNGQTGGFGIGAKSAWSYTDSFNIITYIDGTKRTYVAHTGVNNQGRLDLISTEETKELNGTEIQVSVNPKDINEFFKSIKRAIYFWPKETYFITGMLLLQEKHESVFFNKTLEVITDFKGNYHTLDISSNSPIASIDGVVYPLDFFTNSCVELHNLKRLVKDKAFVLHLPNGFLEVSATREEISTSKHTMDALSKVCKTIYDELVNKIKTEFSKVKNNAEFIQTYKELSKTYNCEKFTKYGDYEIANGWNSDQITSKLFTQIEFLSCGKANNKVTKYDLNKPRRRHSNSTPKLSIAQLQSNSLYCTDGNESMVLENRRINKALELHPGGIILIRNSNDTVYKQLVKDLGLIDLKTIDIATYQPIKRERITRDKKLIALHETSSYRTKVNHIMIKDITKKYLYVKMKGLNFEDVSKDDCYNLYGFLLNKGYQICGVSESTYELIKDNKLFSSLKEFLKNYQLSEVELNGLKHDVAVNHSNIKDINMLKDIKVKRLTKMQEIYAKLKPCTLPNVIINRFKNDQKVKDFMTLDKEFKTYYNETFPLLEVIEIRHCKKEHLEDLTNYVNTKGKGK